MSNINPLDEEKYLKKIPENKKEEALKYALKEREMVESLYWRRAAYFWTLLAAAFAGFFVVRSSEGNDLIAMELLIACIGLPLSVGWYCVNRGSKHWTNNWHHHVKLLGRNILGPIYGTILQEREYRFWFWPPHGPYPFSVTRVNDVLSLFIIAVWVYLIVDCIRRMCLGEKLCMCLCEKLDWWVVGLPLACTVIVAVWLIFACRMKQRMAAYIVKEGPTDTGSDLA